MSDTPITLSDVQAIQDASEQRQQVRHQEVLDRFTHVDTKVLRVEGRVHQLEIKEAETRPMLNGGKSAMVILFTALIAGYVGSLFSQ